MAQGWTILGDITGAGAVMGLVGATATGRTRWWTEVLKDGEEVFFPSDNKASAALVDVDVDDGDRGPFSWSSPL